jgi:hypothetical protein
MAAPTIHRTPGFWAKEARGHGANLIDEVAAGERDVHDHHI